MKRRVRTLSIATGAVLVLAFACRSTVVSGTQRWPRDEPITLRWHHGGQQHSGQQPGERVLRPGEVQHTRVLDALQAASGTWMTSLVSYAPGQEIAFGDGDLRVNLVGKDMIVVDGARLEQWRLLGGAPRPLLELMAELAGMR